MRASAAALTVAILLGGCSGSAPTPDDGATLGSTAAPTPATAPPVPVASPVGTGVVQIGGAVASFAVTECALVPGPEVGATSRILRVTGAGTTAGGVAFTVEVQRNSTRTAVDTFTDSVLYGDGARILQLQRFEVNGEVTDLRDPSARGTLLQARPDGVAAAGLAGPPGSVAGDEGIVGLAIDATCG